MIAGIVHGSLCVCPLSNGRRRYIVTSPLMGWVLIQNNPWLYCSIEYAGCTSPCPPEGMVSTNCTFKLFFFFPQSCMLLDVRWRRWMLSCRIVRRHYVSSSLVTATCLRPCMSRTLSWQCCGWGFRRPTRNSLARRPSWNLYRLRKIGEKGSQLIGPWEILLTF